MHQMDHDAVRKTQNDPAPSTFFQSGGVGSPDRSSGTRARQYHDILISLQDKEKYFGIFSFVKERIFCCITNVCRWCRINRKPQKNRVAREEKGVM